jgi:hypothetical protein
MSKQFSSEQDAKYFKIARGMEKIGVNDFGVIYGMLPSRDTMLSIRDVAGFSFIDVMQETNGGRPVYAVARNQFCSKPSEFEMDLMRGSQSERVLKTIKEAQENVNTMLGHYSVSVAMVDFLLIEYNKMVDERNNLKRKCNAFELEALQLNQSFDSKEKLFIKENVLHLTIEQEESKKDIVEEQTKAPEVDEDEEDEDEDPYEDEEIEDEEETKTSFDGR